MRTLSSAVILLACVGLALLGCADKSQPLVAPTANAISSSATGSLAKMGEDLHSVTGTAHWAGPTIFGFSRIRIAFSAVQHADGTVSGEFQINDESGICKLHGKVFDLNFDAQNPKMAKLCFNAINGQYAGSTGFAVAVDNGEGKNATGPDMLSYIPWFNAGDPAENYGTTIDALIAMSPGAFLTWAAGVFLPPGETSFLRAVDHGSVEVR